MRRVSASILVRAKKIVRNLRKAMEGVAGDPSSLLPKIDNGRRWVSSKFTWQKKARKRLWRFTKRP